VDECKPLPPGETCSAYRRGILECPDKYDADNNIVDKWERVLFLDELATFPGKPPKVVIGSYPPGRWAHVVGWCRLKLSNKR